MTFRVESAIYVEGNVYFLSKPRVWTCMSSGQLQFHKGNNKYPKSFLKLGAVGVVQEWNDSST